MSYYLGGKKRIGKEIANKIYEVSNEYENIKIIGYAEPFCGMMGVYQYIPELFKDNKIKFKASDRNHYLIKLWKGIQNGYTPPITCNKKEYYKLKDNDSKSLKAIFLGFACSIRGVFRSTYLETNVKLQSEHCKNIGEKIKDVDLYSGDYTMWSHLKNYIIYCDPPYKDSGSPYAIGNIYDTNFDYKKFTKWCEKMSEYNIIFISEYNKPCKECSLVWKKDKEKLFVI